MCTAYVQSCTFVVGNMIAATAANDDEGSSGGSGSGGNVSVGDVVDVAVVVVSDGGTEYRIVYFREITYQQLNLTMKTLHIIRLNVT